jgi:MinD-like ATPase involved in chromosome partitioning or flagellar assembly
MFRAVLFAHDPAASQTIQQLADNSGLVVIQKALNSFPSNYEFTVLLNTHDPDLVFMELSDWDGASSAVQLIRSLFPKIAIIGFGAGWSDQMKWLYEQAGVFELLISPVTTDGFQASVFRGIHKLRNGVQENLVAFLPAKAGSGCTTVALNTAGSLAGALGHKVLLIESDLHSGVLSMVLNVKPHRSLLDALENSSQLDYSLWSSCVVKKHGIDLLLSERSKPFPSWGNYHHLLEYVRSRYNTIVVDLPEVVNDATEEILRRSRFVFVVCTPEVLSLKLAQRRCKELEARGIPASRIGIIVNRWHNTDVNESDVEGLLEHGVAAIFPNDYMSVQDSILNGDLVDSRTELGKTFLSLARILAGVPDPYSPPKSVLRFLKSLGGRKRTELFASSPH